MWPMIRLHPEPRILRSESQRLPKEIPLTVCVAAIADNTIVVGVSDRMITGGDIEFEPPQSKIYPVTSSIVMMIAGESTIQTTLIYAVRGEVNRRIQAKPEEWLYVSQVASMYAN